MTTLPTRPGPLLHLTALCLASLAACGGGGSGTGVTDPPGDAELSNTQVAATNTVVMLEGCVVDHDFAPRPQVVRAELDGGRQIASAMANPDGIFVLRVPANTAVHMLLDGHPASALAVSTGRGNLSIGACLIDMAA